MLRQKRIHNWRHSLSPDCRFALRQLRKSPVFAAVAILTLALGIGANTAIFSVINSVLLRSLPFAGSSELVYVFARSTYFDFPYLGLSLPDLADLRSTSASFAALAVAEDSPKELAGAGKPQRLESTAVTEDFFPILGLRPLHGRIFTSADMRPGSRSGLIRQILWRDNFGPKSSGDRRGIPSDGQPFTVIGI